MTTRTTICSQCGLGILDVATTDGRGGYIHAFACPEAEPEPEPLPSGPVIEGSGLRFMKGYYNDKSG